MTFANAALEQIFNREAGGPLLEMLEMALNDELLAAYQYRTCYWMSKGKGKAECDPEFKIHSQEEEEHAEKLMERINELNGKAVSDPAMWQERSNGFVPISFTDVRQMLTVTIEAEKTAIEFYNKILMSSKNDKITSDIIKGILADEEEHLDDLNSLYQENF